MLPGGGLRRAAALSATAPMRGWTLDEPAAVDLPGEFAEVEAGLRQPLEERPLPFGMLCHLSAKFSSGSDGLRIMHRCPSCSMN